MFAANPHARVPATCNRLKVTFLQASAQPQPHQNSMHSAVGFSGRSAAVAPSAERRFTSARAVKARASAAAAEYAVIDVNGRKVRKQAVSASHNWQLALLARRH